MLVVLDLDVVVDLTAERPVKRLPARLLTEYQGAGLEYALVALGGPEDPTHYGLSQVRVLGSEETPAGRVKVIEEAACNRPGVYVTSRESVPPRGWGVVPYRGEPYYLLVHRIWHASPPRPEEKTAT